MSEIGHGNRHGESLRPLFERAIKEHGTEVRGVLYSVLRNAADVEEAYSIFAERLWTSLATFRGETSLRAWCYRIAYTAALGVVRRRKSARDAPRSPSAFNDLPQPDPRESTPYHLATPMHNRLLEAWSRLDTEDQTLLTLRLQRRLEWLEIASVLAPDETDRTRVAAKLRKRFQRLRAALKEELLPKH